MQNYIKVSKQDQKVNTWSGGTTTQLYIFPNEAIYSERNFDFRLSTATVEAEISEFTSLPGVDRKLMILQGSINLKHLFDSNHGDFDSPDTEAFLGELDLDTFKGDWKSLSRGRCVDFNLMTRNNWSGEILGKDYLNGEKDRFSIKSNGFFYLYLFAGKAQLNLQGAESEIINEGDFILFEPGVLREFVLLFEQDSRLIYGSISSKA